MNHQPYAASFGRVFLELQSLFRPPIKNSEGQLRNGWWILIYFLLMALMIFPLAFMAKQSDGAVPIWQQAIVSVIAAFALQRLRRQPNAEMWGAFDQNWLKFLVYGMVLGAVLMLIPALALFVFGIVTFNRNALDLQLIFNGLFICASVAITEELIFRGVFLARLKAGVGVIFAQLLVAAYFWLTHSGNPGMEGSIKVLASINIFCASILFGIVYLRTGGLAMPIGMHMMANFVQGTLLGFGVSGHSESGVFTPKFANVPDWISGGQFGLEASLPGLLTVILFCVVIGRYCRFKQSSNAV